MTDKLLGALGLCRRAGALAAGFDVVCEAAQGGKAELVLLAADASERTRRKVTEACLGRCKLIETDITQQALAGLLSKPTAVLAVTDKNLAALCRKAAGVTEETKAQPQAQPK
ncbi:ribosomal L7Ae/L30e/S12e/Gadd45 family protein [Ruminococcaceae bacterium OttesenSCG-928-D13]|nr:ribosomal L7Ae/L30e/S12e/Gadd45 family protein [Ruminococcaceae bacterium OttesenSCG-928-D13]